MKATTQPKIDHTPAQLDDASRNLLAAATWIEKHGLSKVIPVQDDKSACTAGAIGMTCMDFGGLDTYEVAMGRMAKSLGLRRNHQVCGWNNEPERTAAEVIAKLRAVALGG